MRRPLCELANPSSRATAIRQTLGRFFELQPGFKVSYEGPSVQLPDVLSSYEGSSPVPLAVTALAFLFSEMLTNTAKHQWPGLKKQLSADGIQLMLRVLPTSSDEYDLEILSRPALPEGPIADLKVVDKTIGLTALKMVAVGIGAEADQQEVSVNGISMGKFPFPRNIKVGNAVWSAYALRKLQLVQVNQMTLS
jgi:hypothetical protein